MKLFTVTFDESAEVVIHDGIEVESDGSAYHAHLGTDVGGQTLAMVPFRIAVSELEPGDSHLEEREGRLCVLSADVRVSEDGMISLHPESAAADARAFVVLSVMQRSPDARTELAPYPESVECIGNAYDRPFDKQVLLLGPGAEVRFRRFGRGGHYARWRVLRWDGQALHAETGDENGARVE